MYDLQFQLAISINLQFYVIIIQNSLMFRFLTTRINSVKSVSD